MSKTFEARTREWRLDDVLTNTVLRPRLRALVEADLVHKAGCLVLAPLAVAATGPETFQDRTGFEAFINKVHIEDFIDDACTSEHEVFSELVRQGVKAAFTLAQRLEQYGKYRIFLSLDAEFPTLVLRFFERRDSEPWGSEDPDAYALEEVLMIDTCCGPN